MTTNRDFDRQLGAWFGELATQSLPDGLLRRSLDRVGATSQRPRWLVRDGGLAPRANGRASGRRWLLVMATLAVVAGVVGATLIGARLFRQNPSPTDPNAVVNPTAVQLPDPSSTVAPTARIARPGALIAFSRTVDEPVMTPENPNGAQCYGPTTCAVPRIWLVGSDGGGAHELFPNGTGYQRVLAWSSDGAQLLYSDQGRLYLTNQNRSEPQLVDTGCFAPCTGDYDARLSGDGTKLVFMRASPDAAGYDGPMAIATMDLTSGRVTELSSTSPDGGSLPGWSPDGTQIVFFRYGDKDMGISGPTPARKSGIFIVDADGQNLHQISPTDLAAEFPDWSPDGSRIVFTSPNADLRDIYTIRPDGTDLRQLTTDGTSYGATWTPDGRILFVRGVGAVGTDSAPSFWTMDADGSHAAQLIPGTVTGAAPGDFDWSRGPIWQPIGGQPIVPPPWNPSTSTAVGPPPPTPPGTPMPALSSGFSGTGSTGVGVDTATRLQDGRVLVTSGCGTDAELYDPDTGTFTPTGSLTAARGGGKTATLLGDGRVLIVGGGDCTTAASDKIWASAELYDPATGTFRATGSMGTPRVRHTATLLADGRVLIAGGYTGQSPVAAASVVFASYEYPLTAETAGSNTLSTAELYDPVAGTFSRTGSMHDFRDRHTATRLEDGRVLVVGGGGEGYARTSAELYNPATGTFSRTGSLKSARWLHTATTLSDGRVLITGGRSSNDTDYVTAELYNPATSKFTLTGSMHEARQEQTATLLSDGRVFIAGGYLQDAVHWDVLSSTELYNPVTGKFTDAGSMGEKRSGQTATLLGDGRILIVGGSGVGYPMGEGPTSAVVWAP